MTFGPVEGLTVDISPHAAILVHRTLTPALPGIWDEAVMWAYARGWEPTSDLPDLVRDGLTVYLLRRLTES